LRFENKQIIAEIMARPEVTECIEKIKTELEGHGTILVRKSGTEPVIRLKVEDEDEAFAEQCAARILTLIKPE
jgi:phosphoglucosamine mutase